MEKMQQFGLASICMVILFLGFVSFTACIASEFRKTKAKDLKLDGKLCYAPGSPAFGLGIVASICLLTAQIIGYSVIIMHFCSREKKTSENMRKSSLAISPAILSWISAVFAILILSVATSMNQTQLHRKGWLDGECYMVKDGVYMGSASLVLTTIIFILGSIFSIKTRLSEKQVQQGGEVFAVSSVR